MRLVLPFLALLLLAGCVEQDLTVTLNPDGSGRLEMVQTGAFMPRSFGFDQARMMGSKPEDLARLHGAGLMQQSQGIEAWESFDCEVLPDGRVRVKATGLFKDITAVNFGGMDLRCHRQGDLLVVGRGRSTSSTKAAPTGDPLTMKMLMNSSLLMTRLALDGYRLQATWKLPVAPEQARGGAKAEGATVSYQVDGAAMLAALRQLAGSDRAAHLLAAQGQPDDLAQELLERGEIAPAFQVPKGGAMLFDFAQALAAAEAKDAAKPLQNLIEEQFGRMSGRIRPAKPTPSATAPAPAGPVQLTGLRMIGYSVSLGLGEDEEGEDGPMRMRHINGLDAQKGLKLFLTGQLDREVNKAEDGKLGEARSAAGTSLLVKGPNSEWRGRLDVSLDQDKRTVTIAVPMELPDGGGAALGRIAGSFPVQMVSGTRTIDLGLLGHGSATTADGVGASLRLGAQESLWRSMHEDKAVEEGEKPAARTALALKLDLDDDMIKEIRLLDAAGKAIKTNGSGSSSSEGTVTRIFSRQMDFRRQRGGEPPKQPEFPEQVRVVLELHGESSTAQVSFALEGLVLGTTPPAPPAKAKDPNALF